VWEGRNWTPPLPALYPRVDLAGTAATTNKRNQGRL